MAAISPPPLGEPMATQRWLDWFTRISTEVNTITNAAWVNLDFTSSDLTDVVTRNHNDLQNFDGGTAGERYHLTNTQHDIMINGAYGDCYQDDSATTITISSVNTDVDIDGFTGGQTNNVTFQNNKELKVTNAGKYLVNYSVSFEAAAGANTEWEISVYSGPTASTSRNASGSCHRKIAASGDKGNAGGNTVLPLSANDVVKLAIRNETDTNNAIIDHANLSVNYVGA